MATTYSCEDCGGMYKYAGKCLRCGKALQAQMVPEQSTYVCPKCNTEFNMPYCPKCSCFCQKKN